MRALTLVAAPFLALALASSASAWQTPPPAPVLN